MKKLSKKVSILIGTAVIGLGLMAVPVFAETDGQDFFGSMQSFMGTEAMQSMHNSTAMQEAMSTGDISKMAEAMNTPEFKSIMGEEHVNQMTEYMKNGNMQSMHGQGGMMGASSGMMGTGNGMGFGTQR